VVFPFMSRASLRMRDFAERLIAYETANGDASAATEPAAFRIGEKLRSHLAVIIGKAGCGAFVARGLALAAAEVPWLRAMQVEADGFLVGGGEWKAVPPEAMAQGSVVLVAQLLGLLVAFIGEDLTLRIVHGVWPKLPIAELEFGKGEAK
jgi:hypothetical protein